MIAYTSWHWAAGVIGTLVIVIIVVLAMLAVATDGDDDDRTGPRP